MFLTHCDISRLGHTKRKMKNNRLNKELWTQGLGCALHASHLKSFAGTTSHPSIAWYGLAGPWHPRPEQHWILCLSIEPWAWLATYCQKCPLSPLRMILELFTQRKDFDLKDFKTSKKGQTSEHWPHWRWQGCRTIGILTYRCFERSFGSFLEN